MNKYITMAAIALAAALTFTACGKKEHGEKKGADKAAKADDKGKEAEKPAEGDKKPADTPAEVPKGATSAQAPAPAGDKVAVSATGTNFDPAVPKDKIPEGAWYCDMGTVHFARLDEGDGRCPRCKMKLHKMGK